MTKTSTRYSPEVRERAVRLVLDHQKDHPSQWSAIQSIALKIGCSTETLRNWVRRAERDAGQRAGPTSDNFARFPACSRIAAKVENGMPDLRAYSPADRASRRWSGRTVSCARPTKSFAPCLTLGIRIFRPGGARPPYEEMKMFIDEHRDDYGVEPICRVLPIAPARHHVARRPAAPMQRDRLIRR